MKTAVWRRHVWTNRLQTALLVLVLLGISGLAGSLLLGQIGLWIALLAGLIALVLEPTAAARLTLRLYHARPIDPFEAPDIWRVLRELAERAGLPAVPTPYYVPSRVCNAFTVGNARSSAIAVTNGLLNQLSMRELVGVLAHEVAHIAHGDLRVMSLADSVSRLTSLFALTGQILLLLALPWVLAGGQGVEVNWLALLVLLLSPHLALLAQLGLSRVREFDADLKAAALTGDPEGLALALARIERASQSWLSILLPGWGNPEPSWLRTHPATAERIRRLRVLASSPARPGLWPAEKPQGGFIARPATIRAPRWYVSGLWR